MGDGIIRVVPVPESAPTLAKLELELAATFREHADELAHRVALVLVEVAAAERAARNGNGQVAGPKLCTICRARLAARHRTVCGSCKARIGRERERLRCRQARELRAAANGDRGPRAAELANGTRVDPADAPLLLEQDI